VELADNSDPVCPIYHVLFIDFGNREKVKATSVRPMDPAISAVPFQAYPATLAYLKVPLSPNSDC
jgi:staphylococcal nuclease domain-containing protein 1